MDEKLIAKQKQKEKIIFNLVVSLVTFAIGSIIFIIYFFAMGHRFIDAVNGATLTTIILFSMSILSLLARLGAFDTFAYGFMQVGAMMFSNNPRKYNSMSDYKQAKSEKRKEKLKVYIPMLIVTFLFVIAVVVLEIIYHTIIGR